MILVPVFPETEYLIDKTAYPFPKGLNIKGMIPLTGDLWDKYLA